jgi:hypothetical protein
LLDVDTEASDELLLAIRQSFKDGLIFNRFGGEKLANNIGAVYSEWGCCKE